MSITREVEERQLPAITLLTTYALLYIQTYFMNSITKNSSCTEQWDMLIAHKLQCMQQAKHTCINELSFGFVGIRLKNIVLDKKQCAKSTKHN